MVCPAECIFRKHWSMLAFSIISHDWCGVGAWNFQMHFIEWNCMNKFGSKFHCSLFLRVSMNNIPALVQIIAWRLPGAKLLSEPVMVRLPMHICITQPQWINWGAFKLLLYMWGLFCFWLRNFWRQLVDHILKTDFLKIKLLLVYFVSTSTKDVFARFFF